jgi:hypothetical protein
LKIGRKSRRAVAKLAVWCLLIQAFFAALHTPGIRAAQLSSDGSGASVIIICSANGFRRIAVGTEEKAPDGNAPRTIFVSCPVCLTLACCPLGMPAADVVQPAIPPSVYSLIPATAEVFRDHREAIRPGHSPPISL